MGEKRDWPRFLRLEQKRQCMFSVNKTILSANAIICSNPQGAI